MRRLELHAVTAFFAFLGVSLGAPPLVRSPNVDNPKLSSDSPRSLENMAMEALDVEEYHGGYINMPLGPTLTYLPLDFYRTCADAIETLIESKEPIDKDLLTLAKEGKTLRQRYRAARILAGRGNEDAYAALNRMCAGADPRERYVAWHLCRTAVEDGMLKAPKDFRSHLKLYGEEKDREIRWEMEMFFGVAKAREALPALLETVRKHPGFELGAILALGRIGDARAVPHIIEDFHKDRNCDFHLRALGEIATQEAVDFIIKNLDEYGAVDALFGSKSDRALPVLERHLNKLRDKGDQRDLADTQIAVLRLSSGDPGEELLKIAENPQENLELRRIALEALVSCNREAFHPRVFRVFMRDPNGLIKSRCVSLLEKTKLEGLTEAMISTFLKRWPGSDIDDLFLVYSLAFALNKRLRTHFQEPGEMHAYLQRR